MLQSLEKKKSPCRRNSSISSAYLHMIFRDNMHLFFTKSLKEISILILSMCSKTIASPKNYTVTKLDGNSFDVKEYTSHIKIKSKKSLNITPDNCFILQLAQIPYGSRDPATMGYQWTQHTRTWQPQGVLNYCVLRQLYSSKNAA